MAAAVILDPARPIAGLADSKKLTAKRRNALALEIRDKAIFAVGIAEPEEIDRLNILHATMAAMCRAVLALPVTPGRALVDGNRIPSGLPCEGQWIIGGDGTEPAISAASIIAKTVRDDLMVAAEARFAGYGFAGHKGYGAAAHIEAIARIGPCPLHRRSFSPIRQRSVA